jgi:hypothetical protein
VQILADMAKDKADATAAEAAAAANADSLHDPADGDPSDPVGGNQVRVTISCTSVFFLV